MYVYVYSSVHGIQTNSQIQACIGPPLLVEASYQCQILLLMCNLQEEAGCHFDREGFLHLIEVAEPRYVVPCRRTVDNCLDKMYCAVKAQVQQELKQCECMGLTTDWTSRANDGYISLTAHYVLLHSL